MEKNERAVPIKTVETSQLDKPITVKLLLSYALPIMLAQIIQQTFGIVDGIFAMRGLGAMSMAAITVVNPLVMLTLTIGVLFSAGGSALVVKKVGMSLYDEARQNFTLVCICAFVLSSLVAAFTLVFPGLTLSLLGANYEIMELAQRYLSIFSYILPLMVMGVAFGAFLVAEGYPALSMGISILSSVVGLTLNAIFLFGLGWGIEGLAWATLISVSIPVIIAVCFFIRNKKGSIYFVMPKFDIKAIGISLLNGSGTAISVLTMAAVLIVLNNVVVRMEGVGALGVAVAGVVMGIHGIAGGIFTAYFSVGAFISFNHGNNNHERQKRLFKLNLRILAVISISILAIVFTLAGLLVQVYVPAGTEIHEMATWGLRIASLSFLLFGLNMFASTHFTALNKGVISGTLAIIRTTINLFLLFILPSFLNLTGVWMAWPLTEVLAIIFSIFFLIKFGKKYNYL